MLRTAATAKELAEYRVGDAVAEAVVAPVPLMVVDPEATAALKDKEVAMARLGKMQFKPMTAFAPGTVNEAQLLISHPNYTGMQIDQLTRFWIPPDYVRSVTVRYGDTTVLEVEGDISISEDPAFTFSFVPQAPGAMVVDVEDTNGRKFQQSWPVGPTS